MNNKKTVSISTESDYTVEDIMGDLTTFNVLSIKGQISLKGRYKGQISPYTLIVADLSDSELLSIKLNKNVSIGDIEIDEN